MHIASCDWVSERWNYKLLESEKILFEGTRRWPHWKCCGSRVREVAYAWQSICKYSGSFSLGLMCFDFCALAVAYSSMRQMLLTQHIKEWEMESLKSIMDGNKISISSYSFCNRCSKVFKRTFISFSSHFLCAFPNNAVWNFHIIALPSDQDPSYRLAYVKEKHHL